MGVEVPCNRARCANNIGGEGQRHGNTFATKTVSPVCSAHWSGSCASPVVGREVLRPTKSAARHLYVSLILRLPHKRPENTSAVPSLQCQSGEGLVAWSSTSLKILPGFGQALTTPDFPGVSGRRLCGSLHHIFDQKCSNGGATDAVAPLQLAWNRLRCRCGCRSNRIPLVISEANHVLKGRATRPATK